ncbi:hypothetical protein G6717_07090 [Polynucleobacter paneuropaeus]|nr:hypothetical protein [Polynucleobacter paneuropaeus]
MSSNVTELLSKASAAFQKGQLELSGQLLLGILKTEPGNLAAKELLAYVCGTQGDQYQALQLLKEVVDQPNSTLSALYEYGSLLLNASPQEAIEPLERAFRLQPNSFEVLHDLATAYAHVGRRKDAINKYEAAVRINRDSYELFYNLGRLHDELLNSEKANACYAKSLAINPQYVKSLINLALNLNQSGRFDEGIALLEQVLALEPNADFIFGNWLHSKMQLGLWEGFNENIANVMSGLKSGRRVIHPFHLLSLIDSSALHQRAAEIYSASRGIEAQEKYDFDKEVKQKIRVGYFSSDFRNHAVTNLTAELFELHDRDAFQIYAFSSGFKNNDEQRQRLRKVFDEFIDISELSDQEAVSLVRTTKIDIAVDLGGYTENSRIGVFERRVAPIQVSYLGYLGTLGTGHMDYIFADQEVIPIENEQYFAEKIARLPNCFQINDSKRLISEKIYSRDEFGLPEDGFVFCSFNNSYKITPEIFSSWCRILQKVEDSVLWLYEANKGMVENLQREASSRGVNSERLIFGGTLPIPEYLARYRLADLFLDTFPYNAGTTASDALWAGLPVLTLSGKTFPARMAGSILKAIDLPELVTHTIADYENLAVELATNKPMLKAIRTKLAANRVSTPLFDSPRTTKNIEKAYQIMYERYLEGKDPESIDLA